MTLNGAMALFCVISANSGVGPHAVCRYWVEEVQDVHTIIGCSARKRPGPLLFAMYVSEIDAIIYSHAAQYHQYADDLMIYLSLVPSAFGDLSSLVDCSDAVSAWFLQNALLLNPDKTEAVLFGTRQRLSLSLIHI